MDGKLGTYGIPVIARHDDMLRFASFHCPEDALWVSLFADENQPVVVKTLKRTAAIGSYRRAAGWADETRDGRGIDRSYLLFGQ
ncbi:4Fe-4S ferredoxin [Bradyrhizobium sp. CAR08]